MYIVSELYSSTNREGGNDSITIEMLLVLSYSSSSRSVSMEGRG